MRPINKIILHCSASSLIGQTAATIESWHSARGWKSDKSGRAIGYHYFIRNSGMVEQGRFLEEVGAHAEGKNKDSVGICLAGLHVMDFRPEQFDALKMLLRVLKVAFPKATLHGHNEFSSKECPVFPVKPLKEFWESLPS